MRSGEPQGLCAETASKGIWRREWSHATVEMDCNSWSANITMKSDDDESPRMRRQSLDGKDRKLGRRLHAEDCDMRKLRCDGSFDDTANLQEALDACAWQGRSVTLPDGKTCVSYPLVLPSNTDLRLPLGSVLKAGRSQLWPNKSTTDAETFLRGSGVRNITIRGKGTIDGSGAQWWTGNDTTPRRPRVLVLDATDVLLEDFLILNGAAWNTALVGSKYRIFGVRIRAPPWAIAPNSDGLDIAATDVHVRGADVQNGDDSICIKSPAHNVLVEDSVVRTGNGLIVGTGSVRTNISNITFRNCTAISTESGAFIKMKYGNGGSVSGITYEDLNIISPLYYAIGIGICPRSLVANVVVRDVTFRRIRGTFDSTHRHLGRNCSGHETVPPGMKASGFFACGLGRLECRGVVLDQVKLLGDSSPCFLHGVSGVGRNVIPASCVPTTTVASVALKTDAFPHQASGTTKFAAFSIAGELPAGVASSVGAVQRRDEPLFRQDRPWEPRLDNGCELAELPVASFAPH